MTLDLVLIQAETLIIEEIAWNPSLLIGIY